MQAPLIHVDCAFPSPPPVVARPSHDVHLASIPALAYTAQPPAIRSATVSHTGDGMNAERLFIAMVLLCCPRTCVIASYILPATLLLLIMHMTRLHIDGSSGVYAA